MDRPHVNDGMFMIAPESVAAGGAEPVPFGETAAQAKRWATMAATLLLLGGGTVVWRGSHDRASSFATVVLAAVVVARGVGNAVGLAALHPRQRRTLGAMVGANACLGAASAVGVSVVVRCMPGAILSVELLGTAAGATVFVAGMPDLTKAPSRMDICRAVPALRARLRATRLAVVAGALVVMGGALWALIAPSSITVDLLLGLGTLVAIPVRHVAWSSTKSFAASSR